LDGQAILVINCGSSSLKYEVYDMPAGTSLGKGTVERIGMGTGMITQKNPQDKKFYLEQEIADHAVAMMLVQKALTDPELGLIASTAEIRGVGHRVVHGGESYAESVVIDDHVLKAIEKTSNSLRFITLRTSPEYRKP
jgi:acetate kinase